MLESSERPTDEEPRPRSILVVEDDQGLRKLVQRALREAGYDIEGVSSGAEAIERVMGNPDVILLLDIELSDMTGNELIRALRERGFPVPFVVMTGHGDEQTAVEMMKLGAKNYLVKGLDLIDLLPGAFQRVFSGLETEWRFDAAEEALRRSEERYRAVAEDTPVLICRFLPGGEIAYVNEAYRTYFAKTSEELVGSSFLSLIPEEDREMTMAGISALTPDSPVQSHEHRVIAPDGGIRWQRWTNRALFDVQGKSIGCQSIGEDITEHKRVEQALRESEERFRNIAESMSDWIWEVDADGVYTYSSARGGLILGYREDEIIGKSPFDMMLPDEAVRVGRIFAEIVRDKRAFRDLANWNLSKDGRRVCLLTSGVPIFGDDHELLGYRGVDTDITEKLKMEEQLRQAQKMESIGRLAGGVAHDFNNLLMGIMNYVDLCRDDIKPDHPIREWLDEITHEAQRSADLTRQLLAFARKQIISPRVLDLNDAVTSVLKMLRHLIGEDIDLVWMPGANVWPIKMDPSQIDQILANFCMNARDAIDGVGKLMIETANVTLDKASCSGCANCVPGTYVMLAVSDNGVGMDRETLDHIFEPFFSTKPFGECTGLSLATIYGIVSQNEGCVEVHSEPGKGTRFKIYLPRHISTVVDVPDVDDVACPHGDETVLVAEDEKSIRVTVSAFLEALGYTVLVAETPELAIRLADEHAGTIDLLVTDVVMPGMSGHDLAARLSERCTGLKCLFMSGYTADMIAQRGILEDDVDLLLKPFSRAHLAREVRRVLDTP